MQKPLLLAVLHLSMISVMMGQGKQSLTVERIFQKPSLAGVTVSSIQWSPDGSSVAYLRSDASASAKDLWLYNVAAGKGTLLVRAQTVLAGEQKFSKEEQMVRERTRQTDAGITTYFWSPDSREIFIPLNGDVYSFDIVSKKIRQLTATPGAEFDPKISPTGAHLSYVRDNEIHVLELKTGVETKLTSGSTKKVKNGISEYIAQEEMSRTTGYWWSPDGRQIAYLQIDNTPVREFNIPNYLTPYSDVDHQEYAKAGEANTSVRVGIVSVSGGVTRWFSFGANTDVYIPRVDWLPDGKRVAVQIQSRNQDTLDLRLYDIGKGTSELLLRETDPMWVTLNANLRFFADGKRFLWTSERDGFAHLYLHDMKGTRINQVTKGDWEVDNLVGVDEKAGVVYFTATEKSVTERHLYSTKLNGSGLRRLTTSDGWHDISVSPGCTYFVDTWSTLTRPPVVELVGLSGKATTMIEENAATGLDDYRLPKPDFISVPSADGRQLNAFIIKPSSFDPLKKYPVIIYQYNGPTSNIVENKWGAGGGMGRALWHRVMAEKGYIVFCVDGRGTTGRGRAFQNLIHKRLGKVELEDQLSGVTYLKSFPYVDPSRIMIWGKSYGGFMTCMAMFTTRDIFKLGVAVSPVTDWRNYDTHYTERYLERPQENEEGYRLSSPLGFAGGLKGRFLLIHGVVDDNVHFQESIALVEELQKANKQFDFMPYPRSTHAYSGDAVGTHLYNYLSRYIQENL